MNMNYDECLRVHCNVLGAFTFRVKMHDVLLSFRLNAQDGRSRATSAMLMSGRSPAEPAAVLPVAGLLAARVALAVSSTLSPGS